MESAPEVVDEGELAVFDSLSQVPEQAEAPPVFEQGQIISKSKEMTGLPGLPVGFYWRCIKNATGRSNSRWKVAPVEETG